MPLLKKINTNADTVVLQSFSILYQVRMCCLYFSDIKPKINLTVEFVCKKETFFEECGLPGCNAVWFRECCL